MKEYTEYGECVSFYLKEYKFIVAYRNPRTKITECMSLFTETLNTNDKVLIMGDFNF